MADIYRMLSILWNSGESSLTNYLIWLRLVDNESAMFSPFYFDAFPGFTDILKNKKTDFIYLSKATLNRFLPYFSSPEI